MSIAPPIKTTQATIPLSIAPPIPTNQVPTETYSPIDPQFQADLEAWAEAMAEVQQEYAQIKQLAAHLKSHSTDMYQIIVIMDVMQDPSQSKVKGQSDLLNVDTDMRNQINSGQSGYNTVANSNATDVSNNGAPADAVNGANAMIQAMTQLQAELKMLLGDKAIDEPTFNNLQGAIDSMESPFGNGNWGNGNDVASDIITWVGAASGGTNTPEIKTVQDAFQNQIQTTSALSSSTNTQLQFVMEEAKTILGAWQTSMQAYLKMTSALVQDQKSS